MSTKPSPTDEEIAAAQLVLARANAVQMAAQAEAMRKEAEEREAMIAPLREMAEAATFGELLDQATSLRGTMSPETEAFTHLHCMVLGMNGLRGLIAAMPSMLPTP